MSIAVIGQGFVGGSLTTVLSERGETVYVFDKANKVASGGKYSKWHNGILHPCRSVTELVETCESKAGFSFVYFVCLPTPMSSDGSADLSIVEAVLDELATVEGNRIAVIKSTVPPGSTQKWNEKYNVFGLHIIFSPEFLTEASALDDMRNQNRIILGGPRPHINVVKQVFQRAFPSIPVIKTSSTTAEMVKYLTNCHLAVKVSLANEIAQICEALDIKGFNIDYDKVVEYAKYDSRIGSTHWAVPGPVPTHDGRHVKGYGGHCLPKDLNALISVAKELGVKPTVLSASWDKNLEVRSKADRDWEHQIGRAVSKR